MRENQSGGLQGGGSPPVENFFATVGQIANLPILVCKANYQFALQFFVFS
jgi:hypothetical protein